MKTIHKTRLTRDFTTLPNSFLRSKSISFCAKGILAMMLSHTEEWEMNLKRLAECGFEGRERIRSAVHELEQSGYAVREQLFDPASRKFNGTLWTWHDSPVPQSQRSKWTKKPSTQNPSDGKPSNVFPSTENPSDIKKTEQIENYPERKKGLEVKKNKEAVALDPETGEYDW